MKIINMIYENSGKPKESTDFDINSTDKSNQNE